MRLRITALLTLSLLTACAVPTRVVSPVDGSELTFEQLADELAEVDVVVLGEEHRTEAVHDAHLQILRDLYRRRPDMILSMEMFERDVQAVLGQYLSGLIDEDQFLAEARPWPRYESDYRPVIEFARKHHLWVVAANCPREMAAKVAKDGDAALVQLVGRSPYVAESTTAPEDAYWAAFQRSMAGHGDLDGDKMRRYYQAQCLKDDTMAESIAKAMRSARAEGRAPLVVHICGKFHSDQHYGTVARLAQRMPELQIRVTSVERSSEHRSGTLVASPLLADYLLLIPAGPEEQDEHEGMVATLDDVTAAPHEANPHEANPHQANPHQANPHQANPHEANPHEAQPQAGGGGRPGLGFMPDYDAPEEGCVVAQVLPDSAADKAGLVPGDLIVKIDAMKVFDVRSYAEALDQLEVGQSIKITVRRADTEQVLDAVVGMSRR